ncbi:major capsid protein [Pseudobacteriovorax antillogorgiicola]|uniref:Phage major capsid protein E n=1 Tax=Pseudobacteriovorax antillogorgiicola TaxID=1513793 RepID=A0A1Y6CWA5_9BACT|nr:major capsid protein [Pseudobacteriovorax antillogorgiicola]TCS51637.1 major capsid protein E [Pseudobacteriovorax antillogorgiicola]SMF81607.1 Phage major capsid protein E [Pseudobacteriovorax antillogorgiicola]
MATIELWKDYKKLNLLARQMEVQPKFFAETFFSQTMYHDTEQIHFGDDEYEEGISAFAHPLAEGKVLLDQGTEVKAFAPAYIKEAAVHDPLKSLRVLPEEDYSGSYTPMQRERIHLARNVARLKARYQNRIEIMALEALKDGKATISGEGITETVLNFGRDASLKEVASADADKWSDPSFKILGQLSRMKRLIKQHSRFGAIATTVHLNQSTADYLLQNKEILDLYDKRRGVDLNMNLTPYQKYTDIEPIGRIGHFNFLIHSGYYRENGTKKEILKDGEVILTAPSIGGKKHFGRIISRKAKYKPLSYFLRPYYEDRTETQFVEIHSAPILIPHDVNAAAFMQVL